MSGLLKILTDPDDTSWMTYANCAGVDPALFFPEREYGGPADVQAAKEVCRGCVVRAKCLDYAIANGERHGIWGGETEKTRRRIGKERRAAARSAA